MKNIAKRIDMQSSKLSRQILNLGRQILFSGRQNAISGIKLYLIYLIYLIDLWTILKGAKSQQIKSPVTIYKSYDWELAKRGVVTGD